MKKTYKSLANAYASAEKAGATRFDLTYNGGMVLGVLDRVYKTKSAITVAKNNLMRYENTLCALECVKDGFKWTVVGTFDSDGLVYANVPNATEDKPKKVTSGKDKKQTKKATPRKPAPAKGGVVDFNAFKGTNHDKNSALHAELVSRGMKDSRTDEYQAIWKARPWAKA